MFRNISISFTALACTAAMAQTLVTGTGGTIGVHELLADVQRASPEARAVFFNKPADVKTNILNLYVRRALAAEAVQAGADKDPVVQAALALARDRVLSDLRLAQADEASQPNLNAIEDYARSLYLKEAKRFEGPEQVKVRHILRLAKEPAAKAEAEQLLKDLRAGADFETLAKANSQDTNNAPKGGELGLMSRGRMVKPFEDAAFALSKPGDISEVIETEFGFHIIKLDEKRPAGMRSFEQVKDELMKEAKAAIISNARVALRDRLVANANVNDAELEAFLKSQTK